MKNNNSIWETTIKKTNYGALNHDIFVDIAIVGGGLAGILTAYLLKEEGKKVTVFEKDQIGMGVTKKTTAFISAIHDVKTSVRLKKDGYKRTKQFIDANTKAINDYYSLSKKYNFDFEMLPHIIYTTRNPELLQEEMASFDKLGIKYEYLETVKLPFKVEGAVAILNQAQMNPLKLINELARELTIYEHSLVTSISNNTLIVNGHHVKAKQIVVATNFPFIKRWGAFFMKMHQNRSYVIGIDNALKLDGLYTSIDEGGFYFRNYQKYLLIGGNDTRVGYSKKTYDNLISFAKNHFPNANVLYKWSNQDCVTLDDLPYIGRYSLIHRNIYVITGFNLWGITQAMIAGKVIRDMILGHSNEEQTLFNPHRLVLNKKLFDNAKIYFKRLVTFKKKCPHLGAALVWNEKEARWDCPSHGSSFKCNGDIIHGPTTRNLK